MNHSRMVDLISKRAGIPREAVAYVLDVQNDIMRECLVQQDTIHFPKLLKIEAAPRKVALPGGVDDTTLEMETELVERVMLKVRPMRKLREELNKWTSTES